MDPRIRQMFLEVHGGDPYNLTFLVHIWRHKECDRMLRYLKRQGLVGLSLSAFIRGKCQDSPIHFIGKITKAIANTNTPPALLLGVNYR